MLVSQVRKNVLMIQNRVTLKKVWSMAQIYSQTSFKTTAAISHKAKVIRNKVTY